MGSDDELSLDGLSMDIYSIRYERLNRQQRRHIKKRYSQLDKS